SRPGLLHNPCLRRTPSFMAMACNWFLTRVRILRQPMTMPKQLTEIPILRTRYPYPGKTIFHHQLQNVTRIPPVGLLLLHTAGFDLRRIAHPQLVIQLRKQTFEPVAVSRRFHPYPYEYSPELEVAVKL